MMSRSAAPALNRFNATCVMIAWRDERSPCRSGRCPCRSAHDVAALEADRAVVVRFAIRITEPDTPRRRRPWNQTLVVISVSWRRAGQNIGFSVTPLKITRSCHA